MKVQKNIQVIVILLIAVIMSSCGLFLQNNGVKNYSLKEKIDKKNLNKYQYDFVYLNHLLELSFPQIDSLFPKEERQQQVAETINALSGDNIEKIDFSIQSRKFVSNLENQHTSISVGSKFPSIYPFLVHISYNHWYLRNINREQDSLLIGKEILTINEIPIATIEKSLFNFTTAENKINKQYTVRRIQLYNKPLLLKEINVIKNVNERIKITFTDGSSVSIDPINSGQDLNLYSIPFPPSEVTKRGNRIYSYKAYPDQDFGYLQFRRCHDKVDVLETLESYIKPWLQPVTKKFLHRQFKKEKPSKRMAQYYHPEYPIFKDFVWELIDSLNNNNINNLIIDLRQNPGGSSILCTQLMYFLTRDTDLKDFAKYAYTSDIYKSYFPDDYNKLKEFYPNGVPENELVLENKNSSLFDDITDKESPYYIPENRPVFEGQVYIIANYTTGSAAAMLTTLIQDNEIGTIVGTSVGNNPTGATTYTPFKLPKTNANVSIATRYLERPNPLNGKILQADYWVEYSLDDLITGKDPYLEKIRALIKSSNN